MISISRFGFKSIFQSLLALLVSLLLLPLASAVSYPGSPASVAIPDAGNVNITFTVSGQTAPITNISVDANVFHAWGGDIRLELIAPNGTALDLVRSPGGVGGNTDFVGLYSFVDPTTPGALIFSQATGANGSFPLGSYMTSTTGGTPTNLLATFAALTTPQINGTWTLRAYDLDSIITGSMGATTLNIVGTGTNAVCGTPAASIVAPSGAALCSSGTGTAVTSGVNTFTWGCNSTDGGTNTAANACSSIRQYTVTASPTSGASGSISCTSPVNGGSTTTCTSTPGVGFRAASISGCSGVATAAGVNSYTTAAVVADCTVTATYEAVTNGACATPPASIIAPSGAALCSAGTGTAVTSGVNTYTWGCNGINGGTNTAANACSSIRQYTVTATPTSGASGTISCTSPVNGGSTTTCTSTPGVGFRTASISGCSGVATAAGVNSYTTGALVADCTVTATYEAVANGVCATPPASVTAPSGAALCSAGTGTAVTSGVNTYTWGCNGVNGGTSTAANACSSTRQYTVTATPASGVSGSVSCTTPVNGGSTTTCTASPAIGYTTGSISGCGGTATGAGVNSYTTVAVVADCTVTASFVQIPLTPTPVASPVAGGNISCVGPATFGGTSTCTATPGLGFRLTGISGCGGVASATSPYTTGAITAACVVTAQFALAPVETVPTLSPMMLAILAALALVAGGFMLRRRSL